jgi:hypothetical protein
MVWWIRRDAQRNQNGRLLVAVKHRLAATDLELKKSKEITGPGLHQRKSGARSPKSGSDLENAALEGPQELRSKKYASLAPLIHFNRLIMVIGQEMRPWHNPIPASIKQLHSIRGKLMASSRPRLAYFYNLKRGILEEIQEKGPGAAAGSSKVWSEGWSREVNLATYLAAVEKMIEALASLRDFKKEPLTKEEERDLDNIWLLEKAIVASMNQE